MSLETKIIASGSYGCVFRPGINCEGKTTEDPKFVSKLQSSKLVSQNEINIGKLLEAVPDYEEHFSPIVENCPIGIGEIETKEIGNCEPIKKSNATDIVINKIKYEGENTLAKYLLIMLKENPQKFSELFLETHITLLESLKKLQELEVIHNDIKENNIICRDVDGRPIIIDFGISMEKKYMRLPEGLLESFIKKEEEEPILLYEYFYKYDDSYSVWCIDIVMLNYMLNKLNEGWLSSRITQSDINELALNVKEEDRDEATKMFSICLEKSWSELIKKLRETGEHGWLNNIYVKYGYKWRTMKVTEKELDDIIESYINNNSIFNTIISQEEANNYKTELKAYFKRFIEGGTWNDVFDDLTMYWYSWDVFALSITYLQILTLLEINGNEKMAEYEQVLKKYVLSMPNERIKVEELENNLKGVLKTVPKTVFQKFNDMVSKNILGYDKMTNRLRTAQMEDKEAK
jgi:serine/threonine protein kinase